MNNHGKRVLKNQQSQKDHKSFSSLLEIIAFIKSHANAKFNESIDISVRLGTNATKSDENIRSSYILPYGVARKVKIAAFVPRAMEEEALKAGADAAGLDDLIESIKKSEKIDFDVCFASNDIFTKIVPIAKILGKNGVMPNTKEGTVTSDIIKSIKEVKEGRKVIFKNDNASYIHLSIGKCSLKDEEIEANLKSFVDYLKTLKPAKVKDLIKSIYISSTMGLGIQVPLRFTL